MEEVEVLLPGTENAERDFRHCRSASDQNIAIVKQLCARGNLLSVSKKKRKLIHKAPMSTQRDWPVELATRSCSSPEAVHCRFTIGSQLRCAVKGKSSANIGHDYGRLGLVW